MTTKNFKIIENLFFYQNLFSHQVSRTSGYKYFLKKRTDLVDNKSLLLSAFSSSLVFHPRCLRIFDSPTKSHQAFVNRRLTVPKVLHLKMHKSALPPGPLKVCRLTASEQNRKTREFKLFVHSRFLEQSTISDSRCVFINAVNAVKPIIGVVKTRIRGRAQYIPNTMSKPRQNSLALRWFCQSFQEQRLRKKERTRIKIFGISDLIALEFLKAAHGGGLARKKRNDFYKLAETNRALYRKKR